MTACGAPATEATHSGPPPAGAPLTAAPAGLTVLYDERCALCVRARDWLATLSVHVPLELLAAGSPEAERRYPALPARGQDLVVVAWDGRVWVGPPAYVMCLWAARRYRSWAYRLAAPGMAPLARRLFAALSASRSTISARLPQQAGCDACVPPTG